MSVHYVCLLNVTLLFGLRHASVDSDPGNDHRHQGPAAGHQWHLASGDSAGIFGFRAQRPDNLREDYHLVRDMHGHHAVQLDLDLPEVAAFPTPSPVGFSCACSLGIGTVRDWHF